MYALVIAAIVALTLLRLPLEHFLHGRAPYAFYFVPILLAAWYGGVRVTIVAILASLAAAWGVIMPRGEPGYLVSVVPFLIVSSVMLYLARVARARQDACEFFAAIVESSDDAILTRDLRGNIQSWNQGARRLFGYTADEMIGRPLMELVPPELRDEEVGILERISAGERIDHFETVRIAKSGRRLDLSLTVSPVYNAYGEIIGASKVARDISDRKRAAEAIAAEREWLVRTLESIGDAVIATDADGNVVFMNPVAERLTGWTSKDARGRASDEVFRIMAESTRESIESPITRVLRLGQVVGLANSTLLVAVDGSERPIDDSAAPILDIDGNVRGVVLVFRDVSARRRAETERLNALSEAEQANRSKDEFVAMVSHELRTPLNAIIGWAQIVKGKPTDVETVRRGMEVIERNTRLQTQLISDLLDMSAIISGKLRLDVRDVDVIAIVNAAIETTRSAAEARGVHVTCAVDKSMSSMLGDPTRLQQCVWNLLSNAIKFTPQGGLVEVTSRRCDGHMEITVKDNGIGIRPDFLPFLFDRFRQADSSSTRRAGGLGLGLAIVRQLIELHGGHVRVESPGEGLGSTFTLVLPIRTAPPAQAPNCSPEEKVSLDQIRVLIVEDDPDNREVLRTLLELQYASVTATASANEALETLAKEGTDILVSDIGLPDTDGYELIRRVRKLGPNDGGSVPAIALTAHASREDRAKALRAGFQAHITKPVDPGELVANIARLARK